VILHNTYARSSAYVNTQLKDKNEIVLILPFFEATYSVRNVLSITMDVRIYIRERSLVIIDSLRAYSNSGGISLRPFIKKIVDYAV